MRRLIFLSLLLAACSDDSADPRERAMESSPVQGGGPSETPEKPASPRPDASAAPAAPSAAELTFAADVEPVTSVEQALPRVFVPPYRTCSEPQAGATGKGPDGKVCTNVAISGATEEGKYFPDYGDCAVVITQRPFWSAPPAGTAPPNDPRLADAAYMKELAWVTEQVAASGCVCCHDSKALGKQASQWDIRLGPLWLDSLSDSGLALFAGLADSSVLGAYRPEENNGFDRTVVGIPTTDNARMGDFMRKELARRGISEEQARAVPPFGGPIYDNRVAPAEPCGAGEGVDPRGGMHWRGGGARYVYVTAQDSDNPGVPPNLDLPEGTLFRLDVLASAEPLASGVLYGTTPAGSFQRLPERERAPALARGQRYRLYVLRDVGVPLANCLFEFGAEVAPPARASDAGSAPPLPDAGATADASGAADAGACGLAGGDARGYGAPCKESVDCSCEASYCALMPGQAQGYCSKSGCTQDEGSCPDGWSCFDLSRFAPGQPAICTR